MTAFVLAFFGFFGAFGIASFAVMFAHDAPLHHRHRGAGPVLQVPSADPRPRRTGGRRLASRLHRPLRPNCTPPWRGASGGNADPDGVLRNPMNATRQTPARRAA